MHEEASTWRADVGTTDAEWENMKAPTNQPLPAVTLAAFAVVARDAEYIEAHRGVRAPVQTAWARDMLAIATTEADDLGHAAGWL